LDKKLKESSKWRGSFFLIPSFLFAVACLYVDKQSFIDAPSGVTDLVLLSACSLCFAFFFASQYIYWRHSDTADVRIAELDLLIKDTQNAAAEQIGIADSFLKVVGIKAQRIRKCLKSTKEKMESPIDSIVESFNPDEQILNLLIAAYRILSKQLPTNESLRITLFEAEQNSILPKWAWDGHDATDRIRDRCIVYKDMFDLRSEPPKTAAVWAARHNKELNITDTKEANADMSSPFSLLDAGDQSNTQSLFVIPLRLEDEQTPISHVLTIASSYRGLFPETENDKRRRRVFTDHLIRRLLFELDVRRLLQRAKEYPDDRTTATQSKIPTGTTSK